MFRASLTARYVWGVFGVSPYHFQNLRSYYSIPVSFVEGGCVATTIYLYVLRWLAAEGLALVSAMIAILATGIAFFGVFGTYSDMLSIVYDVYNSKLLVSISAGFQVFRTSVLTFIAPISLAVITFPISVVLTKHRKSI